MEKEQSMQLHKRRFEFFFPSLRRRRWFCLGGMEKFLECNFQILPRSGKGILDGQSSIIVIHRGERIVGIGGENC